jgi:HPt (histidine-containing phosphotransfer) domain-containing protein
MDLASALLPKLLERCVADLGTMRAALQAGDLALVQHLGHRMAGACGSFGREDLAEVGQDLERAAAAGDAAAVAAALERLARRLAARQGPDPSTGPTPAGKAAPGE